jgi:hypothetical protein
VDSNSEGNPAGVPIRTNWLAVGLELLPLAAPLLLLAVGLGFFVAFVAGLGWARIGRANIGVTYATARGTLMAVLFLVVVWAVLAHGSDDARATIPFWILAALWAIPPMISSAIVAVVSRRPERPPVPVPHNN